MMLMTCRLMNDDRAVTHYNFAGSSVSASATLTDNFRFKRIEITKKEERKWRERIAVVMKGNKKTNNNPNNNKKEEEKEKRDDEGSIYYSAGLIWRPWNIVHILYLYQVGPVSLYINGHGRRLANSRSDHVGLSRSLALRSDWIMYRRPRCISLGSQLNENRLPSGGRPARSSNDARHSVIKAGSLKRERESVWQ